MKQKKQWFLVISFFITLATHAAEAPRKRHAPAKTYVCPEPGCRRVCTQKNGLVIHMRVHTGERPFACTICSSRFTQKNNLKRHQNTNTCGYKQAGRPVPKEFSCPQCTNTYSRRWMLANHITIKHSRNRTPSPEPVVAPPPAPAARNMLPVVPQIIIATEEEEKEKTFLRSESAGAMLSAEPLEDYE